MSLKIIGGQFKGRNLKAPTGVLSKPTTSLLRKAVFDICQAEIKGARFLDLFACSGAMGIEALSRGASFATFIESDTRSVRILKQNIEMLSLQKQSSVLCADVFTSLKKLNVEPYQIIYIDPPYQIACDPKMTMLLDFLDKSPLVGPFCSIFIEEGFPGKIVFPKFLRLQYKKSRKFSATCLHELFLS